MVFAGIMLIYGIATFVLGVWIGSGKWGSGG